MYRELLQNADDASSKRVEIAFETPAEVDLDRIGSIRKLKCSRVIFKNDGIHFRPEDWSRLMSIASGNPDEQKVGSLDSLSVAHIRLAHLVLDFTRYSASQRNPLCRQANAQ